MLAAGPAMACWRARCSPVYVQAPLLQDRTQITESQRSSRAAGSLQKRGQVAAIYQLLNHAQLSVVAKGLEEGGQVGVAQRGQQPASMGLSREGLAQLQQASPRQAARCTLTLAGRLELGRLSSAWPAWWTASGARERHT